MVKIIDLFIPREKKFFDYLDRQISLLDDCIKKLSELSKTKNNKPEQLEKTLLYMRKKSDEGDRNAREITNSLHQTFITPIDREEIQSLSTSISGVIDSVENISASLFYFKIKKLDSYFLQQLEILGTATSVLKNIFKGSFVFKKHKANIEKIKELEDTADDVFIKSVGYIFNNHHNAIAIIKQKELYEYAEEAIDGVKHIADILEAVLINNS